MTLHHTGASRNPIQALRLHFSWIPAAARYDAPRARIVQYRLSAEPAGTAATATARLRHDDHEVQPDLSSAHP